MTLLEVNKLIYAIDMDDGVRRAFLQDKESVLERYPLSDEERALLLKVDIAGLYKIGVHPMLLYHYGDLHGIKRPEYKKMLKEFRR